MLAGRYVNNYLVSSTHIFELILFILKRLIAKYTKLYSKDATNM